MLPVLLDDHGVDHPLYAVNVAHKFGGQVPFSRIPGFAAQLDYAFFVTTVVLRALIER